jgi:hypothetical protein
VTGSDLTLWVTMAAAGVMSVAVAYLAVRGQPGVVSLAPPQGSPRWPVYGFFVPWFVAGFAARADGGSSQALLWARMIMFLIVLASFVISWWRLRQHPVTPPRA